MEPQGDTGDGGYGDAQQLDVVILSGQSNMAGRGGVRTKVHHNGTRYKEWDGIVPEESRAEKGSVLRLNVDLEWEEAHEPLHADIDTGKVCGIGPGLTFSATVLQGKESSNSPSRIGLVPCAKGGTSIGEWEKGSVLYKRMINRAKAALKEGCVLKAILWYQGESDTLSEHLARNYRSELEKFINNVRSDLKFEQLPFIQVGITANHHPHPHLLALVREAQREVSLPSVHYVDADGLTLQDDGVHLTTEAQVQLGKMLAEAYVSKVLAQQ